MTICAVELVDLVLAVHILAAVIGFGATFAYPIFLGAGARLDPAAMPWFFAIMQLIARRLIYPGLIVVLVAGIYLAGKEDQFHAFYTQWGIFAVLVLGGIEGAVMAPRVRRLIELSGRELAGAPGSGGGTTTFSYSDEYRRVLNQVTIGGALQSLIVVVTVFLMATHAGA
ncbi:MAG: DUF2269 family protein [Solirubrobacterales bacterium]|nr:DUF2269 family protein [Solirubrobacterales bacterium]